MCFLPPEAYRPSANTSFLGHTRVRNLYEWFIRFSAVHGRDQQTYVHTYIQTDRHYTTFWNTCFEKTAMLTKWLKQTAMYVRLRQPKTVLKFFFLVKYSLFNLLTQRCLYQPYKNPIIDCIDCIWLRCAYQSQQFSGDMVYGQQYAEIWKSYGVIWQDTDNGASTSLDHHCGTLCRWLFVTRHWL